MKKAREEIINDSKKKLEKLNSLYLNLYLSAGAIGCGVCAIAAFSDDDMNRILNLDGKEQFVIYMATIGKKLEK